MCVCVCVCVCVCGVGDHVCLHCTAVIFYSRNVLLICHILNSAGKPKKENALKTICLLLGPDYMSDIIEVRYCLLYLHVYSTCVCVQYMCECTVHV